MGESDKNEIYLSSSPHFGSPITPKHVMFVVIAALLPVAAYGVWLFGVPALMTILVAVASTVVSEAAFRKILKEDVRVGDLSAVVTGLLLAMVLPPSTPPWMTALGGVFAIVVAKEFFGGLGANVFNPALSGRAFLFVSFTVPMTTWTAPRALGGVAAGAASAVDAMSAATPLSFIKPGEAAILSAAEIADKAGLSSAFDLYKSYFLGLRAGCIGEGAIFLILLAFVVLALAKVIDWRAPVAMVATTVAVTAIAGIDPALTLLSGGLLFGATFMVTDYATSPVTPYGRLLFGAGCGLITALIRVFGGYPEGVMFSILIMNMIAPFLNKVIVKKYGWVAKPRADGVAK
jgi:Na+-translocating ferredoxin:NAD+ oxidoreductase subunit D